jgi:hypothetical protein
MNSEICVNNRGQFLRYEDYKDAVQGLANESAESGRGLGLAIV